MMKILVTGGLGFIGSNFICFMLKKYPRLEIVNLDKLTYAACENNLKKLKKNKRYRLIKGDICDKKVVAKAMQGCSTVINFAAETHVDRSIDDSRVFLSTNILGVQTLLEVAAEYGLKRFIQISTDEVYGSIKKGSFSERDSMQPNSPYSASKAAADLLIHSYIKTHNSPVIIVRPTNNFGPYQFPEKLIPLFISNVLQNKKVPVYGQGLNVREWLYVEDCCRAIDLIRKKGQLGEIYNVGAGNSIQNIKLTKRLLSLLGKSEEFIEFVKDRQGHDFRYSLNTSKIKKLGFLPKYNFKEALKVTVDWYLENKKWWKSLKEKFL